MKAGFVLLAVLLMCSRVGAQTPAVQLGDLLFQTSRSAQSLAIQRATHSPYSHVGVVLQQAGQWCVFEAVQTVRCTPLAAWVARGVGGHYVLKRLKQPLGVADRAKLAHAATDFAGKPYDLGFEWSDQRIYCSELVWKLYARSLNILLGTLQRLRDFHLNDPVVQAKMRARYGKHPPLDEPVISPAAVFDSPLLVEVARG